MRLSKGVTVGGLELGRFSFWEVACHYEMSSASTHFTLMPKLEEENDDSLEFGFSPTGIKTTNIWNLLAEKVSHKLQW